MCRRQTHIVRPRGEDLEYFVQQTKTIGVLVGSYVGSVGG